MSIKWLQLLVFLNRSLTGSLVEKAEINGYKGIFVTIDAKCDGDR